MTTMKTIYILAVFLGLQFNTMFAAGNFGDSPSSLNNTSIRVNTPALAPVTPAEADFSDEAPAVVASVSILAPATPKLADFEDGIQNINPDATKNLSPATPEFADFEDQV